MNDAQLTFTFKGTGRREATPSRPIQHGRSKWWRGHIHVEGVTLYAVASPSGIKLPSGASLDDALQGRVEAYLTAQTAKLNRQRRRGGMAA